MGVYSKDLITWFGKRAEVEVLADDFHEYLSTLCFEESRDRKHLIIARIAEDEEVLKAHRNARALVEKEKFSGDVCITTLFR